MIIPTPKRISVLQISLALITAVMVSAIYLYLVNHFCISIYEATLPDRKDYYSKIAKIPIALPASIFAGITSLILLTTFKKYKWFAAVYFLITAVILIFSMLYIDTHVIRGI